MTQNVANAAPKANEGDGAPEIEITEEMADAGRGVILSEIGDSYDCGGTYFDAGEVAEKVFRAMMAARPRYTRGSEQP